MPEYDVSRWIEKRYDKRITAEDSTEALKIAENMRNEEWGEPEATSNDEIVVFNLEGDEVGRSKW